MFIDKNGQEFAKQADSWPFCHMITVKITRIYKFLLFSGFFIENNKIQCTIYNIHS